MKFKVIRKLVHPPDFFRPQYYLLSADKYR